MDEEAVRRITGALSGSPYPLTAPEIARKIPGWTKKMVNQHIYSMGRIVEQVPGTQPPKWKLVDMPTPPQVEQTQQEGATGTSTLSVCSSSSLQVTTPIQASSDEDIKQKVLCYIQTRSSPVSAPDISKSISSELKCDTADIKRILYALQREGEVNNLSPKGQKPLWEIKRAKPKVEKLNGKSLYMKTEDENGDMKFTAVTRDHLNDDPSSNSKPLIENTPTKKLPPENTSIARGDPVKEGGSGGRSVPVKLATRFDGLTVEDNDSNETVLQSDVSEDVLRQKILDFLKSHPDKEFKPREVATSIGYPTRDRVFYILENLKDEEIVEKTNDGHFKII